MATGGHEQLHRASVLSIPEVQLIGSILDDDHDDTEHDVASVSPYKQLAMPQPQPQAQSFNSIFTRSTSAPPQLSLDSSLPVVVNGSPISPEDPRLSPAYYNYYYSQRPIDPRLPPPLLDYSAWGTSSNGAAAPDTFKHMRLPFRQPDALQQPKPMSQQNGGTRLQAMNKSAGSSTWGTEKTFGSSMIQHDFPRTPSPMFPTGFQESDSAARSSFHTVPVHPIPTLYPVAFTANDGSTGGIVNRDHSTPDIAQDQYQLSMANLHIGGPQRARFPDGQMQGYSLEAISMNGYFAGGGVPCARNDSRALPMSRDHGGGHPVYPNNHRSQQHTLHQQPHQHQYHHRPAYFDMGAQQQMYYPSETHSYPSHSSRPRSSNGARESNQHSNGPVSAHRGRSDDAHTVSASGGNNSRSAILHELRIKKHNHQIRLADVIDQGLVSVLATDQNGSRFIQMQLEQASDAQLHDMFAQLEQDTIRLSVDVFANYVIQKFFEFGLASHRRGFATRIQGSVLPLSMQMYGCRVVQKALEVIDIDQQLLFVDELRGHIEQCVKDQNGNHVIQKCIEKLPHDAIAFVVDAFIGNVFVFSTHAYGCRVIQRLLEHCKDPKKQDQLLAEIMSRIPDLIVDQFGNYVVQHIIQRGPVTLRDSIIAKIKGRICEFSRHKFASNVVEKCFTFGSASDKEDLVREVCGEPLPLKQDPNGPADDSPIVLMVKDQFGNFVVQKILAVVSPDQRDRLIEAMRSRIPNMRKIAFGKHISATVTRLTGLVI